MPPHFRIYLLTILDFTLYTAIIQHKKTEALSPGTLLLYSLQFHQHRHFIRIQLAILPRLEMPQSDPADREPRELLNVLADRFEHAPYLAVLPLVDRDLQ